MAPFERFTPSKGEEAKKSSSNKGTFSAQDETTYRDLLLPWHDTVQSQEFDRTNVYHRLWTGKDTENDADEFFSSQPKCDLDTMEHIMSNTAGPYLEWRKAHPDLAGTEQDMLRRSRREIERLQQEVGVKKGEEWVKSSVEGFLLVIKRL